MYQVSKQEIHIWGKKWRPSAPQPFFPSIQAKHMDSPKLTSLLLSLVFVHSRDGPNKIPKLSAPPSQATKDFQTSSRFSPLFFAFLLPEDPKKKTQLNSFFPLSPTRANPLNLSFLPSFLKMVQPTLKLFLFLPFIAMEKGPFMWTWHALKWEQHGLMVACEAS